MPRVASPPDARLQASPPPGEPACLDLVDLERHLRLRPEVESDRPRDRVPLGISEPSRDALEVVLRLHRPDDRLTQRVPSWKATVTGTSRLPGRTASRSEGLAPPAQGPGGRLKVAGITICEFGLPDVAIEQDQGLLVRLRSSQLQPRGRSNLL
jgi:hypothetical protein